ncbi:MAG: RNA polymerase sigma factor RpoD/SigA [Holophaga sp.]|jgi:RNA polymerase primary sigma factor
MAQRFSEDQSLNKYFDLIRDLPLLTPEEEVSNGRLWQSDRNPEGLRRLVEGNLRFVVKEARKFQGMGLDFLDLVSEGNLGLIEAAKRFDPERGNKFLTYANWWVRQAIFQALADHGSKIRLPQKLAGHITQLNRIVRQLEQDLGRVPTAEDIAENSHFSVEEVGRLQRLQVTIAPVSTELSVGESDLDLEDTIEQTTEPSAMHHLEQKSFLEQLRLSLGILKERERRIISMHFGLDDRDPMTLEQIGQSFEPRLSRERVRQLEAKAFMKVREHSKILLGQFLQVVA